MAAASGEALRAGATLEAASRAAPLPAWPDAWYIVARSRDVAPGRVVEGRVGERDYILFRSESGALAALDAHCPHMGTHLRSASVVGERLRCALHHWTIGRDGVLQGAASCDRFRSRPWPIAERYGLVFVYPGTGAAPAMPFVDDEAADAVLDWSVATPLVIAADWRAMVVNGFDTEHMRAVHQRAVRRGPEFSRTRQGGLRMQYETQVLAGGGLASWLTARLARSTGLHLTQVCQGPTLRVESRLGRFHSRAVFGLITRAGSTVAYASFGAPRGGPLAKLRLWLTRVLYTEFLRKDFAVVVGMRLIVDGIADPGVRGISDYLRSLPALPPEPGHDNGR